MTTRTEKVLQHLQGGLRKGYRHFYSSPYLSTRFGIRNLPDAIKKLRAKGHDIRTTRADVVISSHLYQNVAIYTYYKAKKNGNKRTNQGARRRKGHCPKAK